MQRTYTFEDRVIYAHTLLGAYLKYLHGEHVSLSRDVVDWFFCVPLLLLSLGYALTLGRGTLKRTHRRGNVLNPSRNAFSRNASAKICSWQRLSTRARNVVCYAWNPILYT